VPLDLHLRGGKIKVDLALAKGRKKEDRRAAIAEKESKIEMRRAMGRQRRGKPE
jgi:SsrA-binding protein